jgi:hypothetical protein
MAEQVTASRSAREPLTRIWLSALERWAPLSGALFAVLVMAGYLVTDAFPDETTSVSELTTYYAAHHAQVGRGGWLEAWGGLFLVVFGAALWARLRRAGASPTICAVALLGAALAAVDGIGGANVYATLGTIGGSAATDPAALQAWHIGGATGGAGLSVGVIALLLAVAAASLTVNAVPRWLGWAALVLVVGLVTPAGFFAGLLFLLWSVLAGITLAVRPLPEDAR